MDDNSTLAISHRGNQSLAPALDLDNLASITVVVAFTRRKATKPGNKSRSDTTHHEKLQNDRINFSEPVSIVSIKVEDDISLLIISHRGNQSLAPALDLDNLACNTVLVTFTRRKVTEPGNSFVPRS